MKIAILLLFAAATSISSGAFAECKNDARYYVTLSEYYSKSRSMGVLEAHTQYSLFDVESVYVVLNTSNGARGVALHPQFLIPYLEDIDGNGEIDSIDEITLVPTTAFISHIDKMMNGLNSLDESSVLTSARRLSRSGKLISIQSLAEIDEDEDILDEYGVRLFNGAENAPELNSIISQIKMHIHGDRVNAGNEAYCLP